MSESAYNSPIPLRRFTDSCCSSPARSIGYTPDILTDSDGESDLATETPGPPEQTIIAGWCKFRDNKKVSFILYKKKPYFFLLSLAISTNKKGEFC